MQRAIKLLLPIKLASFKIAECVILELTGATYDTDVSDDAAGFDPCVDVGVGADDSAGYGAGGQHQIGIGGQGH
ncbi:hypothetical protein QVD17_30896 [Tagetes erecta]|uniref:Uncharacterized protein n=1 Tax=Tagetes erecta TaxID=13708 RepID=A0AAD8NGG3_TARER|nr:hypothetical protein QVD17_30896 [Tagetes erecta]